MGQYFVPKINLIPFFNLGYLTWTKYQQNASKVCLEKLRGNGLFRFVNVSVEPYKLL